METLSACLAVGLACYRSSCQAVGLPACLPVRLSICLICPACLPCPVCLPAYKPLCLSGTWPVCLRLLPPRTVPAAERPRQPIVAPLNCVQALEGRKEILVLQPVSMIPAATYGWGQRRIARNDRVKRLKYSSAPKHTIVIAAYGIVGGRGSGTPKIECSQTLISCHR